MSSSGHLILARWALGWGAGDGTVEKAFDVAVHLGTLIGAAVYLRADIGRLVHGALRGARAPRVAHSEVRLAWMLLVASVPAAIAGALFESTITDRLGEPWLIAVMLIVGAGLL